jgi:ubiquinone/menaquinone biosynthesis C-methylase UbiE
MHAVDERSWNDFWARLWRIDHRHDIPNIHDRDKKLVAFIEHVCELKPPMKILDLACGGGDQARHFARLGYDMVGVDIAPSLIEYAGKRSEAENVEAEFITGNMFEIDYDNEFDACVVLGGSFGFKGGEDDIDLLKRIHKSLKPGGRLFLMFRTLDRLFGKSQVWFDTPQGWLLCEEVYNENLRNSSLNWYLVDGDNNVIRLQQDSQCVFDRIIQCYTLEEMENMLTEAGFESLAGYGGVDYSIPPKELPPERLKNIITGIKA